VINIQLKCCKAKVSFPTFSQDLASELPYNTEYFEYFAPDFSLFPDTNPRQVPHENIIFAFLSRLKTAYELPGKCQQSSIPRVNNRIYAYTFKDGSACSKCSNAGHARLK